MYQSTVGTPRVAPYFEKSLDRWKLALLIPLFLLLLAGAVYRQRINSPLAMPQLPTISSILENQSGAQDQVAPLDNPQMAGGVGEAVETVGSEVSSSPAVEPAAELPAPAQPVPAQPVPAQPVPAQPVQREFSAIQPLPHNGPKDQPAAMPLTLAKPAPGTTILQNDLAKIEGTAAPGATVIIDHGIPAGQGADGSNVYRIQTLGEVRADPNGRWQLWLAQPLQFGAQQLSVKQIDAQSGMQTTMTPIEFSVTNSAANASSTMVPVIYSPQTATRLAAQCAGNAQYQFTGVAMPGWAIQLYINQQPAGKTRAAVNRAWTVDVMQPLTAGAYIAHTVLLSPGGEVAAKSSPVAFTVMPCQ